MTELGISRIGPRVEKHTYTNLHVAAAEQWAESGLRGAMVGAIEIAASHYARAFAVAEVSPAVPALTPALLAGIARRLIVSGESIHVIDIVDGAVRLLESSSSSVVAGGPDPASWRYQCELPGPHTSETRTVPSDQIDPLPIRRMLAHRTLARHTAARARRHHGRSRIEFGKSRRYGGKRTRRPAGRSGQPDTAAGRCGRRIRRGQTGRPGGPVRRRSRARLRRLRGRTGLVETTAAGYGEGQGGRLGKTTGDHAKRIGPNPPESLGELRRAVEETTLSCCGIPPGLARAEGGESRESYRRWYTAGVQPMASLIAAELRDKLDSPDLRLDFASLCSRRRTRPLSCMAVAGRT